MGLLTWLWFVSVSHAEYRVYQLQIANGETHRQVLSTLDDIQYRTYYPLNAGETIVYLDSWMCYKRGDNFARYCPKPVPQVKPQPPSKSAPTSARPPASTIKS